MVNTKEPLNKSSAAVSGSFSVRSTVPKTGNIAQPLSA